MDAKVSFAPWHVPHCVWLEFACITAWECVGTGTIAMVWTAVGAGAAIVVVAVVFRCCDAMTAAEILAATSGCFLSAASTFLATRVVLSPRELSLPLLLRDFPPSQEPPCSLL